MFLSYAHDLHEAPLVYRKYFHCSHSLPVYLSNAQFDEIHETKSVMTKWVLSFGKWGKKNTAETNVIIQKTATVEIKWKKINCFFSAARFGYAFPLTVLL